MKLRHLVPIASVVLSILPAVKTKAQIIPDSTLGSESSVVHQIDRLRDRIDGGAMRGRNLFHSFQEFNVGENRSLHFSNPAGIENILTRVTGNNASNIFGKLGVLGEANLFLVNPNGIIFGPNASLDMKGSFLGTTAEGIQLGETGFFSASSPESSTLLSIDPNVGFHNALANYQARIENQGNLQVGPGETLSLQGSEVNITGNLTAEGGNVEVLGNNITLGETSTIDVTSGSSDGGTVRVFAIGNTSFLGEILARVGGDTGKGGFVEVSGGSLQFGGTVDTSGNNGNNGTLLLDPKDIVVEEGGTLTGESLSQSLSSNNVRLQANNDISIDDDITGTSGNSLTLEAGRSITVEQNRIISLGGGDFIAKINDENAVAAERDAGIARLKIDFESQIITEGGNVVIEPGTFGGVALGEVELDKGTIDAGGGNILLRGRGGAGESNRDGIYLHNGSLIETIGTGTIDLIGTGGDGINDNQGIYLIEQSVISSVDGDINLSGTGGNATGASNQGIIFERSTIESSGMGNISLTGIGVSGGGGFEAGIRSGSAKISTVDGDITLTGTGLDTNIDDSWSIGLNIESTTIESAGEGEITLRGTGGTGGDLNFGIFKRGGTMASNNGDINLIGTGGTGGNINRGVEIDNRGVIVSEGGGNITITGTSNGVSGEENIGLTMTRGTNRVETQGGGAISLIGIGSQDSPDIVIENTEISQTGTSEILSLQGNRIDLDRAQLLSSGLLQLQPTEPTADLSITFDTVALGRIETGSEILIGSQTNSGTITLSGNALFNNPVSILSPLGNGSINSQGVTLVENENATINLTASQDINLSDSNIYAPQGLNITSLNGTVDTTDSFIFDQNASREAPLIPDGSLGTERSIVVQIDGESQRIEGGASRGSNLFHSFEEFNIGIGENVYFANPNNITNILTRVTGNNPSQIFGNLGVDGPANLFLVNPNGTIFGPTASLDVSSSFLTTSAGAIRLENGEIFSSNSREPLPQQLLQVNPQSLLFTSETIGQITNQGNLEVPKGQSLLLVGGDVTLGSEFLETFVLGSSLEALGGRIEIGGLTSPGEIGLSQESSQWQLAFPEGISRGNITLRGGARVNVASDGGGDIIVTGQDIEIVGGDIADNPSVLRGGIEVDEGSLDAVAGDITIDATGELRFEDIAEIANNIRGQGTGGDINIVAESVSFSTRNLRGVIENSVSSEGVGDAGNIDIRVGSFSLSGGTVIVGNNRGVGDAASVSIKATDTFEMNGSGISTIVFGEGNAGDITIKANRIIGGNRGPFIEANNQGNGNSGRVSLEADTINLVGGFLRSQIAGEGESSSINIQARSIEQLSMQLRSETIGPSRSSDINITAENIVLERGIFRTTTAGQGASGDGGDINIVGDRIQLGTGDDGPQFSAGTDDRSSGNGGSINITARELLVDGSRLNTGVLRDAIGTGGTINLEVAEVLSLTGERASQIRADVDSEGRGDGGDINITAGELRITEGSVVQASTQGQGNAGQINVNAGVVDISGSNAETGLPSGLFTSTKTEFAAGSMTVNSQVFRLSDGAVLSARSRGNGEGGTIIVNTDSFEATNGGQLVTTTFGEGTAGNIEINASASVVLLGSDSSYLDRVAEFDEIDNPDIVNDISETGPKSGLYANTTESSTGAGGTIALEVGQLIISDRAQINANSAGEGEGGNINISGNLVQIEDRGSINAATASGSGGNVILETQDLRLRNNSNIVTNAGGTGNGGDITIIADTIIALEDSNITANAVRGRGGNISITTSGLFLSPDSDITASSLFGISGIVTVDNPNADPSSGIVNLPSSPQDPSQQIVKGCAGDEGNRFTITGRGGLPEDPTATILGTRVWRDLQDYSVEVSDDRRRSPRQLIGTNPTEKPPFLEATSWVRHSDGTVELVAKVPHLPTIQKPFDCRELSSK